jgi:phospholipase/carboxylesterase
MNLKRAYNRGFEDIRHIQNDPDFDSVKTDPIFKELLDTLAQVAEYKNKLKGRVHKFIAPSVHYTYVRTPEDYDSTRTYPLLIGLHGLGASGESFIGLYSRFEDPQFIFACIQAPYPFDIGDGTLGYSWQYWAEDSLEMIKYRQMTESYVMDRVTDIKDAYPVDDVYLIGFSQGGGLTMTLGLKHPDVFKAAIPWGGWLDDKWVGEETIKAAVDQDILIVHGVKDRNVGYENAENALEVLQEHNFKNVSKLDFDGGHSMPAETLVDAQKWLMDLILENESE